MKGRLKDSKKKQIFLAVELLLFFRIINSPTKKSQLITIGDLNDFQSEEDRIC